jgi:hypothetical protein
LKKNLTCSPGVSPALDATCLQGGKLLFAEMLFNVLYHAEKWAEAHPELAQQPVKVGGEGTPLCTCRLS